MSITYSHAIIKDDWFAASWKQAWRRTGVESERNPVDSPDACNCIHDTDCLCSGSSIMKMSEKSDSLATMMTGINIVIHHAHINDERDSPAAESAARSQNNYQNKSKEQERIILVHIVISMATWMIAMLSWAGQLALTTDSYPVAEWFDSIAHDETAMIIGQINVRIAFKCPHSPTGRDNGLRNHPVRVRIPVKAQFPPLCVMLGGMSNHMPVTWEQYCSHEHMWLQKYSTVRFDYGGRVCSPH